MDLYESYTVKAGKLMWIIGDDVHFCVVSDGHAECFIAIWVPGHQPDIPMGPCCHA